MGSQKKDGFSLIKINIGLGFISKFGSFLLSYLSLPIALNYLGIGYYGVWVVIFSVVSWIYNFDVGVGLGLKNKLNKALIAQDYDKCNELIATSYIILTVISVLILIVSISFIFFIDLQSLLNVDNVSENELKYAIIVSVVLTIVNFVLLLYKQLFAAINNTGFAGLTTIFYQLLVIVLLLSAKYYLEPSLLIVSIIYGASNILVGFVFSVVFFKKNKVFKFKISNFRRKYISVITGIGLKFFIIQICMIIIFTSDNIIISNLLGPDYVTGYSLILKTYQAFIMISYIVLTPYWTLFAEAYQNNNIIWIIKTYKRLFMLFSVMLILLIIYSLFIDVFLKMWLRTNISYTNIMIIGFCLFVAVRTFIDICAVFLNGTGYINYQLYSYIFAAIVNIPLSIILIKYYNFKSEAVIISTTISILPMAIILPIQTFYLLRKNKWKSQS
ncbi:lipopolysaccharide biosynthesis protein [Citrobacter braakii]|uniref:lipopolysaccharide biosynthesis protein n=1 Tax=Citrobacter braakii TaxID=57706 RepID=UPI002928F3CF|nr:oligosaccharide flippase family protein [Citrobacter braakii]